MPDSFRGLLARQKCSLWGCFCSLLTGRGFPVSLCYRCPRRLKHVPASLRWLEYKPPFWPPFSHVLLFDSRQVVSSALRFLQSSAPFFCTCCFPLRAAWYGLRRWQRPFWWPASWWFLLLQDAQWQQSEPECRGCCSHSWCGWCGGEKMFTWEWFESFAAGSCCLEGGRDGAFPSEVELLKRTREQGRLWSILSSWATELDRCFLLSAREESPWPAALG